jgi:hypothetical protein
MSAPKRTYTARPISSANDGRVEWLDAFRKNVSQDRTAPRAWEMLRDAGLETAALRALWTYAHPPTEYMRKARRNVRHVGRQIKALIRADKIEKDKHNAGDQRATLFFDRSLQKYIDVLRSEMPFADDGVTVGNWSLSRAAVGKGIPDLPASRKAFVSLGPRGTVSDRKLWLFVLLCYAENAGVRLGLERLTALACCADPAYELDPRTLARFLASVPARFKTKCQSDLRNLPAPPIFPPPN